jgi:hypothetical protein
MQIHPLLYCTHQIIYYVFHPFNIVIIHIIIITYNAIEFTN